MVRRHIHVTSVQTGGTAPYPAPESYAISGKVVYTVTDANGCTGTVNRYSY